MPQTLTIWYIVADHDHAKIIAHDSEGFALVDELITVSAQDPNNRRSRSSQDFAHLVAEAANKAAAEGSFTKLVLVARPDTSSAIRAALNRPVLACLAGEHHLDLVKLPMADLPANP